MSKTALTPQTPPSREVLTEPTERRQAPVSKIGRPAIVTQDGRTQAKIAHGVASGTSSATGSPASAAASSAAQSASSMR